MSSLLDGISVGSLTPKRKSKVSFGSLESSYLGSNLFVGQKRIETEETNPNLFQVDKTPISKNLTKKVTQKFSMWSDNFETNLGWLFCFRLPLKSLGSGLSPEKLTQKSWAVLQKFNSCMIKTL